MIDMITVAPSLSGLENRQGGIPALEGSTPSPSSKSFKYRDLHTQKKRQRCAKITGASGVKGPQKRAESPQKSPQSEDGKRRSGRRFFRADQTRALPIPKLSAEFSTAFWSRVQIGLSDDCWNWTGATATFGYGRVKISGRLYSTHRIAYTLANGPILDLEEYHGAVVRHSCDNPCCCNPAHLCIGDQRANVHDMVSRGRQSNGGCRHA